MTQEGLVNVSLVNETHKKALTAYSYSTCS